MPPAKNWWRLASWGAIDTERKTLTPAVAPEPRHIKSGVISSDQASFMYASQFQQPLECRLGCGCNEEGAGEACPSPEEPAEQPNSRSGKRNSEDNALALDLLNHIRSPHHVVRRACEPACTQSVNSLPHLTMPANARNHLLMSIAGRTLRLLLLLLLMAAVMRMPMRQLVALNGAQAGASTGGISGADGAGGGGHRSAAVRAAHRQACPPHPGVRPPPLPSPGTKHRAAAVPAICAMGETSRS